MRRWLLVLAIFGAVVPAAEAQIGKSAMVRAGTPEDKALMAIDAATDGKEKVALLDKFVEEFGQTDAVLSAYERYITLYTGEKEYDKAFEYGAKTLAYDPENFQTALAMVRAAQEKGDAGKLGEWGQRAGQVLRGFREKPAPEGMAAEEWTARKARALEEAAGSITYIEYTLFNTGVALKDAGQKAALLEQFVSAFPESTYAGDAATVAADAYRQARNPAKMVEFAAKTLARTPDNAGLLLLLAEHWTDARENFDKAEEYAKHALDVLNKSEKPAGAAEEQWQQQKNLQLGLAQSTIGQIDVYQKRDALAVEPLKAAAPLLKPYDFYNARNLYFLGLAYRNLKKPAEARTPLSEAAALNTPFKAFAQDELNKLGPGGAAKSKVAKKRG